MKFTNVLALAVTAGLMLTGCDSSGGTRDSIRAVGSSTVYPFAKQVAESFSRSNPDLRSPLIESTGSGAGIALFCQGVGADTPDMANASRRMKVSEFETCRSNGVTEITEIQVGLDGIAFASTQGGIMMELTPEIVYRALAANPYGEEQTNETWADIDPSLPDAPILVYGPPSTSGTRDALKELVLTPGCESDSRMAALKESDEDAFERTCTEVRSDGAYVDQGEQDNLIVQKIEGNPIETGEKALLQHDEFVRIDHALKQVGDASKQQPENHPDQQHEVQAAATPQEQPAIERQREGDHHARLEEEQQARVHIQQPQAAEGEDQSAEEAPTATNIQLADIEFAPFNPEEPEGIHVYPLVGNPKEGAFQALFDFPAGMSTNVHTHSASFTGALVSGTHHRGPSPDSLVTLTEGSVWSEPAESPHMEKCGAESRCIIAASMDGPLDTKAVELTPAPAAE